MRINDNSFMDVYQRQSAKQEEWRKSYQTAKIIMDYPFDVELTFEPANWDTLISCRIPGGKISVGIYPLCINVDPYLFEQDTSENFRQFAYSHEIGEIETSNSPITIYFYFRNLISFFTGKQNYNRERHVNKRVYDALCKQSNPKTVNEKMRRFVSEWLDLKSRKYDEINCKSTDKYIKETMPFLEDIVAESYN